MKIVSFNCYKAGYISSGGLQLKKGPNNKLQLNIYKLYKLLGENASLCKFAKAQIHLS